MKAITPEVKIGETGIMELAHLYHLRTIITAKDSTKSPWSGQNCYILHLLSVGNHEKGHWHCYNSTKPMSAACMRLHLAFMKDMGDGIVVVAIRSALIMDNVLYAYAGCGVVADSDADEEYAETNNKMCTILDAL